MILSISLREYPRSWRPSMAPTCCVFCTSQNVIWASRLDTANCFPSGRKLTARTVKKKKKKALKNGTSTQEDYVVLNCTAERVFTFCIIYFSACFNSLAPGRFQQSFRRVIFKLISVTDDWGISCKIALRWMPLDLTDENFNIGSSNGSGISIGMHPSNERRRYNVTTSLIGCAHT